MSCKMELPADRRAARRQASAAMFPLRRKTLRVVGVLNWRCFPAEEAPIEAL